jgi:hypothetical protein
MVESTFMHGWMVFLGSLAIIVIILTAFGIMLGILKAVDATKLVAAILGIIILLALAPGIIVSAWLAIPLWQRVALFVIGICIWQLRRPRRQTRKKERH